MKDNGEMLVGWLQKKAPSGLVRTWKRRFFILKEDQLDSVLKYYENEARDEKYLKGSLNLNEVLEIRDAIDPPRTDVLMRMAQGDPDAATRFNLVTQGDRVYELAAPTLEEKLLWTAKLSEASQLPLASSKAAGQGYAAMGYQLKLSGASSGGKAAEKWERRFLRIRNDEVARHLQCECVE